jgi:hypothetical protein
MSGISGSSRSAVASSSSQLTALVINFPVPGGEGFDIEEAAEADGVFTATLRVEPYTSAATVEHGAFRNWRWLATMEQRWIKPSDWRGEEELFAERYHVMEVKDVDDRQAFLLPPVASGDLRMWTAEVDPALATSALCRSQPLVSVMVAKDSAYRGQCSYQPRR